MARRRKKRSTKSKPARAPKSKLTPAEKAARTRVANRLAVAKRELKLRAIARKTQRSFARRKLRFPTSLHAQLVGALESMLDHAPLWRLSIRNPPAHAYTPWLVLGAFYPPKTANHYADVADVFSAWESDDLLAAAIHPERWSFIRLHAYQVDDDGERLDNSTTGYAAVSSGSWVNVISEAYGALDPAIPDSLASKYEAARVQRVEVSFAEKLATTRRIAL